MKLNPIQQQNFVIFIEENIEVELEGDYDSEWKCICPFCNGGNTRRQSFDINIAEGVARCWRANNCGWKGSAESLIMDVLEVPFLEAREILNRGENSSESILRMIDSKKKEESFELVEGLFTPGYCTDIYDDEQVLEDVIYWIEVERNFDFHWFMSKYNVVYPQQIEIQRNKVAISVVSNDIEAYQLYHFRDPQIGPKTVNPDEKILSKCLFNLDNLDFDRDGPILIVEGIFDAVRMESFGINAVAIFGTYLQPVQLAILEDLPIDEICLCLDYGVEDKIINNNIDKLKKYTTKDISQVVFDEPWMDPDEFGEKEELFRKYLDLRQYISRDPLMDLLSKW